MDNQPLDDHISVSRLGMLHRCAKQYEYRYVKGIKEPPALKPTAGKAGHAGIEAHLRHKMATKLDPPLELTLDSFDSSWNHETQDIELQPEEDAAKTKDYVVSALTEWHTMNARTIDPRAVEQEFLLQLPTSIPTPPVLGYIDIIKVPVQEGPAVLDIDDTKFVFPKANGAIYPKTQADIDWSDQHTMYDMAMDTAGIHADRLGMISMVGATETSKGPRPARIVPVYRDPELMRPPVRQAMRERLIRKVETLVQLVQHGTFMPTNQPHVCSWCGYRKICPDSLAKDDFLAQQIRAIAGDPAP